MNFGSQTPTIVVLKEGTDASQGKGQIISNINACVAVQEALKPTLGPLGSDILIVTSNQKTTISNDGATILKLLDVVHPAAKTLVDISRAQDAEVGDGTTSVTYITGCLFVYFIKKNNMSAKIIDLKLNRSISFELILNLSR